MLLSLPVVGSLFGRFPGGCRGSLEPLRDDAAILHRNEGPGLATMPARFQAGRHSLGDIAMNGTDKVSVKLRDGRVQEYPGAQAAQFGGCVIVHRGPHVGAEFDSDDVESFGNHISAAAAQRVFAADNDAIADRLDAAGHGDLAAVYRDTAREHRDCAARIRTGCDSVTHSEGTKPHGVIPTWN